MNEEITDFAGQDWQLLGVECLEVPRTGDGIQQGHLVCSSSSSRFVVVPSLFRPARKPAPGSPPRRATVDPVAFPGSADTVKVLQGELVQPLKRHATGGERVDVRHEALDVAPGLAV